MKQCATTSLLNYINSPKCGHKSGVKYVVEFINNKSNLIQDFKNFIENKCNDYNFIAIG